ncbi:MAG: hypothetical protein HC932_04700 [Thermales bacterium]|nr:hypothetical protein [Thermales bacterium]
MPKTTTPNKNTINPVYKDQRITKTHTLVIGLWDLDKSVKTSKLIELLSSNPLENEYTYVITDISSELISQNHLSIEIELISNYRITSESTEIITENFLSLIYQIGEVIIPDFYFCLFIDERRVEVDPSYTPPRLTFTNLKQIL